MQVAVGGTDGTVRLVDLSTGRVTHMLDGFKGDVQSLCWQRLSLLPWPQHTADTTDSNGGSWRPNHLPSPQPAPAAADVDAAVSHVKVPVATGTADVAPPPPPPPPLDLPPSPASGSMRNSSPPAEQFNDSGATADIASQDAPASAWRDVLVAGSRDAAVRLWVTRCALVAIL